MAGLNQEAVREAYIRKFDPQAYLEISKQGLLFNFHQVELHHLFNSDLVQGNTLLEIGTGPVVNFVLSASSRFKDIVLSDLVKANRTELEKWVSESGDAIDCTFRAEMVAALEGCDDVKKRAAELTERTRRAIRKVIPGDVLEPGVLPEEHRETFDAVLSCNCLEAAAEDHASYRVLVRNVATLVKSGGLLILAGVGGLKMYPVGNEEFPMINMTEDLVKTALEEACLKPVAYRTKMYDGDEKEAIGKRFGFVIAARKP